MIGKSMGREIKIIIYTISSFQLDWKIQWINLEIHDRNQQIFEGTKIPIIPQPSLHHQK